MEKMENAATALHRSLSTLVDGCELVNIKFFLGDNRNITADELCQEASKAVTQIRFGQAKKISDIDCGLLTFPIDAIA